jgi:2-polyprenyl-6-methoxyphenol hydroxylase-like FAD-dependent oxidoreductase
VSDIYDLVVVGRGPVGLTAANCASQLGMKVAVVERHRDLYALPRAGHVDHEIVRLFQSLGIVGEFMEDAFPMIDYVWVNQDNEKLLEFDWGHKAITGYQSDYMQFQPIFENALSRNLDKDGNVRQFLGYEADEFEQDDEEVRLTLAKVKTAQGEPRPSHTGETTEIRARYVIASDGANSGIRQKLGIEREDLGFNEKWLVVDARKKHEIKFDFDCGQICDPARPVTVLPLGKSHRRWEWMVLPGETVEEMEKPGKAWELLGKRGVGPDDVEIIRQLCYTFEARHAQTWHKGRIFLAGDAAHTTPPFMGQGMCSGMRDAKNLVWKLDLVLRGVCGPELFETYEPERFQHTKDWTTISLEAGKVPCTVDPEEARVRDEKFRSGWLPPMPDFPKLNEGVLQLTADGRPAPLVGDISLQGNVEKNGKTAFFDDFFPSTGFTIITVDDDAESLIDARMASALKDVRARFVRLGDGPGCDARDADGTYEAFFAENGIKALICRPDFYVFGTVAHLADLPDLLQDMLEKLHYRGSTD